MSDSPSDTPPSDTPSALSETVAPVTGAPVKLPPLKLPPKPVAAGVPASSGLPATTENSGTAAPSVAAPSSPLKPPAFVPPGTPPAFKPPGMPVVGSGIPSVPKISAVPPVPPSGSGAGVIPAAPVRPEAVNQPDTKPLPQATIKLQAAPAPSAARRPIQPLAAVHAGEKSAVPGTGAKEDHKPTLLEDEEIEEDSVEHIPLPFAIGAAVLALAAVGIQVWTYLS